MYRCWNAWARTTPGALVCHPIAVVAVAILVANDHLLKAAVPGVITGKLSDFAGLIFFPLLLVAAAELVGPRSALEQRRSSLLAVAIAATAIAFVAVKAFPAGADALKDLLGFAQWLVGAGWLTGSVPEPAAVVADLSDLVALPALTLSYWVGRWKGIPRVMPTPRAMSPVAVAMLLVSGLATIATSPAMRSSSTSYEETVALTADAPAATRHVSVDITNRDVKLNDIVMLAGAYSTDPKQGSRDATPGVIVSLSPDQIAGGRIGPTSNYGGTNLSFLGACRTSCQTGATVVVRLAPGNPVAAATSVATNLVVDLFARASEEGTGPVDIDLGLRNDADRAFQGTPTSLIERYSGSLRVGAHQPDFSARLRITIAGDVLREPYGYPLVGQISVGVSNATSVGDSDRHYTAFEFTSPALPPQANVYRSAGMFQDQPTILDVLPLCEPSQVCEIDAELTSRYGPSVEVVEGARSPQPGSIDLDWFLEVWLEGYDGRVLPEGAITIEEVD